MINKTTGTHGTLVLPEHRHLRPRPFDPDQLRFCGGRYACVSGLRKRSSELVVEIHDPTSRRKQKQGNINFFYLNLEYWSHYTSGFLFTSRFPKNWRISIWLVSGLWKLKFTSFVKDKDSHLLCTSSNPELPSFHTVGSLDSGLED